MTIFPKGEKYKPIHTRKTTKAVSKNNHPNSSNIHAYSVPVKLTNAALSKKANKIQVQKSNTAGKKTIKLIF
ncbi:hypothetical protein SDC9_176963 [bioreactor metagenome]|uniref:Uncharacterized protein n=1 Tax=bioreactor metagenome TaxID=1076179 RepID=A0A645GT95_9ZZZZ